MMSSENYTDNWGLNNWYLLPMSVKSLVSFSLTEEADVIV
jgi:hypothetical protein